MTNNSPPGVVVFDPTAWRAAFPAFSNLTDEQAQFDFDCACDYLNNTPQSPVRDLAKRERLLWLLTAHIAQLSLNASAGQSGGGSNGGSGLVGRVSSASRGSVSVSTDATGIPGSGWWFAQTQYGATFWQATLPLRQMRFIPGRPHPAKIFP
ncbi:DUF4054 domain-containing protein [Acetobacteraceae bacterium]|nr:DUF4054 domain-containing protein [Acetobacteraceae bacterium]